MTSDSSSLLKRSHPYMWTGKKQSHLASEKSVSTCMQENATLMSFLDLYEKQVSAHKRENSRHADTSFLGLFDFRLFAVIRDSIYSTESKHLPSFQGRNSRRPAILASQEFGHAKTRVWTSCPPFIQDPAFV